MIEHNGRVTKNTNPIKATRRSVRRMIAKHQEFGTRPTRRKSAFKRKFRDATIYPG